MAPENTDVAIVGGGISGLYSAWRLVTSGAKPAGDVRVYESSHRVGGRIDTGNVTGSTSRVEYGPIRFPAAHKVVTNLLQYLKVKIEQFPMSLRHIYLRGRPVVVDAQGNPENLPFDLSGVENDDPFQLLVQMLNRAVPNALNLTPAQWDEVVRNGKFKGRPLWECGLWNVAEDVMSNEAYQLLYNGVGIESALANWNAAMSIRMMSLLIKDFTANNVFHPTDGWDTLPKTIESTLTQQGCGVYLGQRLRKVGLTGQSDYPIELTFDGEANSLKVKHLILAMPRRALELVRFDRRLLDDGKFRDKLDGVRAIPAFRIYISYSDPWWQTICGWKDGFTVTDLPIRQVFYGTGVAGNEIDNERVLMASYADYHSVEFWRALAQTDHQRTMKGALDLSMQTNGGPVLKSARRQLRLLHGIMDELPPHHWASFIDWTKDPFGGGWHAWLPGVNLINAIPAMRQPFPNVPISVCGEAYSHYQGWIEGALTSAERVLQDQFKLAWPEWLPKDADLGP